MPSPASSDITALRTLALVGPSGAGKTSLAEALLHQAGAITAPGSLERGSTTSDHDPLERRAQHSLYASVMHMDLANNGKTTRVHFIDTPGGADCLGQALPALEAVETAAIVINAAVGIEPMAQRMMEYAASRQLDRLIIVNKIDAPGANLLALLQQIQSTFGRECLPVNLPDAGGSKVVDCFFNRDGHSDFGSVDVAHRALVEQVVEVDAAFVDRYLNEGDVEASELHVPLEQALREGHLIPVCFVSAHSGAGVAQLLDIIVKLLPCPLEANPPSFLNGEGDAAAPVAVKPDASLHVLAHVFKVIVDPFMGKVGICRVYQGRLAKGTALYVGSSRKPFRVAHVFMLQGKEFVEVAQALPGDIVALAKVDDIHFDAVLHDAPEDAHLHLQALTLPVPVYGLAIDAKRAGDEQRLWEVLGKLVSEDPCLRLENATATHETVLYGLGELHLRMLLARLQEVYRFEVNVRPPKIAYRETVTLNAEGHHRHKKQSGGAGQFGEVFLRIEPLARGAGFEFVDQVKGGTIPGQYMAAVEKGVREVLVHGAIAGYPVVDVRVIVYDGKHHSVDSKDIAFATAGRKAFLDAIRAAKPIVLEPIAHIEVSAPEHATGDITGDLASRRGVVTGTSGTSGTNSTSGGARNANGSSGNTAGTITVHGLAPVAELATYQSRLNALTSGQGRYTVALARYEAAPGTVQAQLVSQYKAVDEA